MTKSEKINILIGYITVPEEYLKLTEEQRNEIRDKIITEVYKVIDKKLLPQYNRIDFINQIFESTLISNEQEENYEYCQLIWDCQKKLNES